MDWCLAPRGKRSKQQYTPLREGDKQIAQITTSWRHKSQHYVTNHNIMSQVTTLCHKSQ